MDMLKYKKDNFKVYYIVQNSHKLNDPPTPAFPMGIPPSQVTLVHFKYKDA